MRRSVISLAAAGAVLAAALPVGRVVLDSVMVGTPVSATSSGAEGSTQPGAERARAVGQAVAPLSRPEERGSSASRSVAQQGRTAALATGPVTFRIGSFNTLGSWHTRPGRDAAEFGPGPMRAHWAAEVVRQYAPGVVGLQEIELDQISVLAAELPNYSFYPGSTLGDKGVRNNVMWDNTRYDVLEKHVMDEIFVGLHRYNAYVKLRDKATGRMFWVMDVHNSPNRGGNQTYEEERRTQVKHEVTRLNQLIATGLPVFFVGDLNDQYWTHCYVVTHTSLRPPQGGGSSCTLPPNSHIDWIFGTRTTWSDYKWQCGPLVARATDHHVAFATATLN